MVGIVLAGGASRRMGADKAQLEVAGRSMAEWAAAAMEGLGEVVMVGRRRGEARLDALPDLRSRAKGPLSGLYTALEVFRRPLVATAVDQPLVRAETISRLAGLAAEGRTAVCVDRKPQVTCAAYSADCLEEAARQAEAGGSIQQMLRSIPWTRIEPEVWRSWGEDGRSWYSMDSPHDIIAAEQRFRLDLLGRPALAKAGGRLKESGPPGNEPLPDRPQM